MHRIAALLPFILAVSLAAQTPAETEKLVKSAGISLEEAIGKALKVAGNGFVHHAELEDDGGKFVFSIDVAQGEKSMSVVLDVEKGELVEQDVDEDDLSATVLACKITLAQGIVLALGKQPGKAIEAEVEMKAADPVIVVKIWTGSERATVRVDARKGELLEAKAGGKAKSEEKQETEALFTDRFTVAAEDWRSSGINPYFVLEAGYRLVLEGLDGKKPAKLVITILDETRKVDGVETRIVEEREEVDGKLVEVSRNFFAFNAKTGGIYYFGEEVDIYEDGKIVKHEGAWESGKDGARFGLLLPGEPLLGARHYQEIAPKVAMDRAEVRALDRRLQTAAGEFTNCLVVRETTPLEPDVSEKIYAPGIGIVKDDALQLTSFGKVPR